MYILHSLEPERGCPNRQSPAANAAPPAVVEHVVCFPVCVYIYIYMFLGSSWCLLQFQSYCE